MRSSPFAPFFERQGFVLLDGGLATALEARGHDLNDPLWSARVLLDAPESISAVHRAYLQAGADCIATVTYQATFQGFQARGMSEGDAEAAFRRAVALAVDARDDFWSVQADREARLRPLVAASVGPYGAFLADGSEYRGDYDLDVDGLEAFHRRRWRLLAETPADLLGCETIPSAPEARALLRLLDQTPEVWAWFSFQCRDEVHLADGTQLREVADLCAAHPRVVGVGVNCVPPHIVPGLLRTLTPQRSTTAVLAYPNSGDVYDAVSKRWAPGDAVSDLAPAAVLWRGLGATVLGGCCRTTPDTIQAMRRALLGGL